MKGSRDAALLVLLLLVALSVRFGADVPAPGFDEVQAASPAADLADLPAPPDEVVPCPLDLDAAGSPDRPALAVPRTKADTPARRTAVEPDECRT